LPLLRLFAFIAGFDPQSLDLTPFYAYESKKNNHQSIKLNNLISDQPSGWLEKARERAENSDWLGKSASIALKVLHELKEQSMSQKDLAEKLHVSTQYVSKLVKGKENLSLETICKLEKVLNTTLISLPCFSCVMNISIDLPQNNRYGKKIEFQHVGEYSNVLPKI
jgi:transcriptional regulator with XRE-family HTH domain